MSHFSFILVLFNILPKKVKIQQELNPNFHSSSRSRWPLDHGPTWSYAPPPNLPLRLLPLMSLSNVTILSSTNSYLIIIFGESWFRRMKVFRHNFRHFSARFELKKSIKFWGIAIWQITKRQMNKKSWKSWWQNFATKNKWHFSQFWNLICYE